MKLLDLCKKARDEKWDDDKIELELYRIKEKVLKEILEGLSNAN